MGRGQKIWKQNDNQVGICINDEKHGRFFKQLAPTFFITAKFLNITLILQK